MVENGRDKSRSVPLRFLDFIRSFSYFWTNMELVRNTGCQICKRDGNGLACIPIDFCISRILSGYPVFTNSVYTVFTTMCVAMTMNLLNLLSECKLMSCDYILHYYVCGCELLS